MYGTVKQRSRRAPAAERGKTDNVTTGHLGAGVSGPTSEPGRYVGWLLGAATLLGLVSQAAGGEPPVGEVAAAATAATSAAPEGSASTPDASLSAPLPDAGTPTPPATATAPVPPADGEAATEQPSAVPSWPFQSGTGGPEVRFEEREPRDPDAGRGTRDAGIALTAIGGLVTVVGIVMLVEAGFREGEGVSDASYAAVLPSRIGGGLMLGVGGVMTLIGIPLWVSGSKEMDANAQSAATLAPTVTMGPAYLGLGWTM